MHHSPPSTQSSMPWSLILLAVFTSLSGAAVAQVSEDVPRVTLHARKMPFLVALRRICVEVHTEYRFDPDAATFLLNKYAATDNVSLNITSMPLNHAISYLLRRASLIDYLTFREDKDVHGGETVYVFSLGNGIADQKTTVHLVDVPLLDALRGLCDQLGANYAFNLGGYERQSVTVSLDNMPVGKCVLAILESAHAVPELTFEADNGVAIVGYKFREVYDSTAPRRNPMADTLYLKCTHQNAYYTAWAVGRSASENFNVPDDLKSRDVSLTFSGTPITKALQSIGTYSKTPLVIKFDGGVLDIALKHPKNQGYR